MPSARLRELLITTFAVTGLISCSGDAKITAPPPPPPATVLLKDVVVPNLPSPYYHFEYDAQEKITSASFASALKIYDVAYTGGRIAVMQTRALANPDQLVYVYDDAGRVGTIKEMHASGVVFTVIFLTYTGDKLTGLERDRRVTGGFILDKTMSFSYSADGNLFELTEHRPAIEGFQTETTTTDRFEDYDGGLNVDAFDLIHDDFFDHLVLLPDVLLQTSNPRRVTRTGDGDNYSVVYTYTYDTRNRPQRSSGDLMYVTGPHAGEHFQVGSAFTYYN